MDAALGETRLGEKGTELVGAPRTASPHGPEIEPEVRVPHRLRTTDPGERLYYKKDAPGLEGLPHLVQQPQDRLVVMVQQHSHQGDYVGTDWEGVLMKVPPGQFHPPHNPQPGQTYLRSLDHGREVEQLQLDLLIPPRDLCEECALTTTDVE